MSYRIQRLNNLIKEEISKIIQEEFDLEGVFITVIDVETSVDCQHSKVKIGVFPTEKSQVVIDFLMKNIYHIQQILNRRLNMRPVPKINFKIDKSEQYQEKVDETLGEIK